MTFEPDNARSARPSPSSPHARPRDLPRQVHAGFRRTSVPGVAGFEETYRKVHNHLPHWEDRDVEYIRAMPRGSTTTTACNVARQDRRRCTRRARFRTSCIADSGLPHVTPDNVRTNNGYGPATGRKVDVMVFANLARENEIFLETTRAQPARLRQSTPLAAHPPAPSCRCKPALGSTSTASSERTSMRRDFAAERLRDFAFQGPTDLVPGHRRLPRPALRSLPVSRSRIAGGRGLLDGQRDRRLPRVGTLERRRHPRRSPASSAPTSLPCSDLHPTETGGLRWMLFNELDRRSSAAAHDPRHAERQGPGLEVWRRGSPPGTTGSTTCYLQCVHPVQRAIRCRRGQFGCLAADARGVHRPAAPAGHLHGGPERDRRHALGHQHGQAHGFVRPRLARHPADRQDRADP